MQDALKSGGHDGNRFRPLTWPQKAARGKSPPAQFLELFSVFPWLSVVREQLALAIPASRKGCSSQGKNASIQIADQGRAFSATSHIGCSFTHPFLRQRLVLIAKARRSRAFPQPLARKDLGQGWASIENTVLVCAAR